MASRYPTSLRLLLALVLIVVSAGGSGSGDDCATVVAQPIPTDGPYLYKVDFLGITCGHMVLESRSEVRAGREVVHMIMTAWNSKFFNRIYRVDARIESWVDVQTRASVAYESVITEKGETEVTRYTIDPAEGVITAEENGEITTEPYDGEPALDPLAFIFALRAVADRADENVALRLFTSDGPIATTALVGGLEDRRTYRGRMPLLRVQPAPESGSMFSRKGEMVIWIEPGPERTLHRLDFRLSFGRLVADLRGPAAQGASRGNLHGTKDRPDDEGGSPGGGPDGP
jgi:hypothetical protein